VYLEGHDDDEEEQEGMLPAMKVSENFTNYGNGAIFKTSCTLYRSFFGKNWKS
jgi:hypothetical protein